MDELPHSEGNLPASRWFTLKRQKTSCQISQRRPSALGPEQPARVAVYGCPAEPAELHVSAA